MSLDVVKNITPTSIRLTWMPKPGATGYKIVKDGIADSDVPMVNENTAARFDMQQMVGYALTVELAEFEGDGITPFLLTGNYTMIVTTDNIGNNVIINLSEGSGLTKLNNKLTIHINQNQLAAGLYYYWIRVTNGSDPYLVYYGTITINHI